MKSDELVHYFLGQAGSYVAALPLAAATIEHLHDRLRELEAEVKWFENGAEERAEKFATMSARLRELEADMEAEPLDWPVGVSTEAVIAALESIAEGCKDDAMLHAICVAAGRLRALECDLKRLEEENRAWNAAAIAENERLRALEAQHAKLRNALEDEGIANE